MNLKQVGGSIYAIGHNSIAGGEGPCALTGDYGESLTLTLATCSGAHPNPNPTPTPNPKP